MPASAAHAVGRLAHAVAGFGCIADARRLVYGLANLGGIRAIIVSAMVMSTALGPGLTGVLIDRGIPLPVQMLWMALWCVAASFAMAIAARAVHNRGPSALSDSSRG